MPRIVVILILLSLVPVAGSSAQTLPGELSPVRDGLHGPVKEARWVARSWDATIKEWAPITLHGEVQYDREGRLLSRVLVSSRGSQRAIYEIGADGDTAYRVPEVSAIPLGEGRTPLAIERHEWGQQGLKRSWLWRYESQKTMQIDYEHGRSGIRSMTVRDSATGRIIRYERFLAEQNRRIGSEAMSFGDGIVNLADTARMRQSDILRSYTNWVRSERDTINPLIVWAFEMGNDTIADLRHVRRYTPEEQLYAAIRSEYEDGSEIRSVHQLYDPYGQVLSTSVVDRRADQTLEIAYDYVYGFDEAKNWVEMRQYISGAPGTDSDNKVLKARVDREITYWE